MKHIFLCGFMGCGKSTVGRALARALGLAFTDLDALIEQRAGVSIPELFAQEGEPRFRALETDALHAVCAAAGQVVATGGGALLRPENAAIARAGGTVVFLNCPFAVCLARIAASDRPLVRQNSPAALEELYRSRLPLYRAACHMEADGAQPPEEAAEAVRSALERLPQ